MIDTLTQHGKRNPKDSVFHEALHRKAFNRGEELLTQSACKQTEATNRILKLIYGNANLD